MKKHNRPGNLICKICLGIAFAISIIMFISWKVRSENNGDVLNTKGFSRNIGAGNAVYRDVSKRLQNIATSKHISNPVAHVHLQQKNLPPTHLTLVGVEQTEQGSSAPPDIVASFDGIGEGFEGPQGTALLRNPSDNSLAVGKDHIVQIVNTRMAIFTKKGKKYSATGKALYGPVPTNNVFKGFGDAADINNGDAVVRYDQLADRWLIVMPIFRRLPQRPLQSPLPKAGDSTILSVRAVAGQPGDAVLLTQPPHPTSEQQAAEKEATLKAWEKRRLQSSQPQPKSEEGSYAMCYAISTSPDPLGSYYRYEFVRPLFPDYPRPAVWPDGYYIPSSTGDEVIQKHAFVVDRLKMLKGEDATEQGVIIDDINFLNDADLDGSQLPPAGAPNILLAAGGSQLKKQMEDDGIYAWQFHVDWNDPSKTKLEGPTKITVAPYHYLCDGQLTKCVPQPGTEQRLDAQGDKLMSRLIYRRRGDTESVVGVQSVNSAAGGGGVRWYEFRIAKDRSVSLYQQGTYAPDENFRWMPSAAMDKEGNIGIGYSFGGAKDFPGQRFAARLANDPLNQLTEHETVLVEGEAAQTNTLRWMDFTQTAVDPSDDETIWFVGDYLKKGATNYSTRIGGFKIDGNPTKKNKRQHH